MLKFPYLPSLPVEKAKKSISEYDRVSNLNRVDYRMSDYLDMLDWCNKNGKFWMFFGEGKRSRWVNSFYMRVLIFRLIVNSIKIPVSEKLRILFKASYKGFRLGAS